MRGIATGFLLVLCAACGASNESDASSAAGVQGCKDQFSPSAGFGWQDDLSTPTSRDPEADAGPPPPTPSALDRAASACAAAGKPSSECDATLVMTHDAAICVARSLGLAEGIRPWKAGLTFHATLQQIVWNVANTTRDDGVGGEKGGDMITLHALTGAMLSRSNWFAIP